MTCVSDSALFYGLDDDDALYHSIEECIEHHFEDDNNPPESVVVYIHRHMTPSVSDSYLDMLIDGVLDSLYSDYGNPEDLCHIEINDRMRKAASGFTFIIIKEFVKQGGLWRCDQIGSETVRIADYLGD